MFEEEVGVVIVLNGVVVCEAVSESYGCRKQDKLDLQRKSAIARLAWE